MADADIVSAAGRRCPLNARCQAIAAIVIGGFDVLVTILLIIAIIALSAAG